MEHFRANERMCQSRLDIWKQFKINNKRTAAQIFFSRVVLATRRSILVRPRTSHCVKVLDNELAFIERKRRITQHRSCFNISSFSSETFLAT